VGLGASRPTRPRPCVFYRELTGRDATNSSFLGGLANDDARFLQLIAGDVVDEYQASG
jgi:hypothetical protein